MVPFERALVTSYISNFSSIFKRFGDIVASVLQNATFPTPPLVSPNFHMFPWDYVGGVWATKSEGVGIIVRAISFQDFQTMWS